MTAYTEQENMIMDVVKRIDKEAELNEAQLGLL